MGCRRNPIVEESDEAMTSSHQMTTTEIRTEQTKGLEHAVLFFPAVATAPELCCSLRCHHCQDAVLCCTRVAICARLQGPTCDCASAARGAEHESYCTGQAVLLSPRLVLKVGQQLLRRRSEVREEEDDVIRDEETAPTTAIKTSTFPKSCMRLGKHVCR